MTTAMRILSKISPTVPARATVAPAPTHTLHIQKSTHALLVTRGPDATPLSMARKHPILHVRGAIPSHMVRNPSSPANQSRCNLRTRTSTATPSLRRSRTRHRTWVARRPPRMRSTWGFLLLQAGDTHMSRRSQCSKASNTPSPQARISMGIIIWRNNQWACPLPSTAKRL